MVSACSELVAGRYGERMRAIAPDAELVVPADNAWPERALEAAVAYFPPPVMLLGQAVACRLKKLAARAG